MGDIKHEYSILLSKLHANRLFGKYKCIGRVLIMVGIRKMRRDNVNQIKFI
jgi:hypothetical protein